MNITQALKLVTNMEAKVLGNAKHNIFVLSKACPNIVCVLTIFREFVERLYFFKTVKNRYCFLLFVYDTLLFLVN